MEQWFHVRGRPTGLLREGKGVGEGVEGTIR